jgi:hypothetical protein
LHIEKTGSQLLASAFSKLANLVWGRSEGPLSALLYQKAMSALGWELPLDIKATKGGFGPAADKLQCGHLLLLCNAMQ